MFPVVYQFTERSPLSVNIWGQFPLGYCNIYSSPWMFEEESGQYSKVYTLCVVGKRVDNISSVHGSSINLYVTSSSNDILYKLMIIVPISPLSIYPDLGILLFMFLHSVPMYSFVCVKYCSLFWRGFMGYPLLIFLLSFLVCNCKDKYSFLLSSLILPQSDLFVC